MFVYIERREAGPNVVSVRRCDVFTPHTEIRDTNSLISSPHVTVSLHHQRFSQPSNQQKYYSF